MFYTTEFQVVPIAVTSAFSFGLFLFTLETSRPLALRACLSNPLFTIGWLNTRQHLVTRLLFLIYIWLRKVLIGYVSKKGQKL